MTEITIVDSIGDQYIVEVDSRKADEALTLMRRNGFRVTPSNVSPMMDFLYPFISSQMRIAAERRRFWMRSQNTIIVTFLIGVILGFGFGYFLF